MTLTPFDRVTLAIFAVTFAVWISWDVVLGAVHAKTESMWIAEWSRWWNALAFFLGALVGHWLMQSLRPHYSWWPFALVALGVVVGWDLLSHKVSMPAWTKYPGLWMELGVACGYLFWPQKWVPGG